jgi:hypothetical protein
MTLPSVHREKVGSKEFILHWPVGECRNMGSRHLGWKLEVTMQHLDTIMKLEVTMQKIIFGLFSGLLAMIGFSWTLSGGQFMHQELGRCLKGLL